MLNTTFSSDPCYHAHSEWTPLGGLCRGSAVGALATLALTASTIAVQRALPALPVGGLVSLAVVFLATWIICGVVQKYAGMVGFACSALSLLLSAAMIFALQADCAVHGRLANGGEHIGEMIKGWDAWFSFGAILVVATPRLVVALAAVWLRHDGSADSSALVGMATFKLWI